MTLKSSLTSIQIYLLSDFSIIFRSQNQPSLDIIILKCVLSKSGWVNVVDLKFKRNLCLNNYRLFVKRVLYEL